MIKTDLDPRAHSAALASFAQADVARRIASNEVPSQYSVTVDNVKNASPEAVRPGGYIRYDFGYEGEIARYAVDMLRSLSPIGPGNVSRVTKGNDIGHFRNSFYVAVNGRLIMESSFNEKLVPEGATIIIGNIQPYSRKIDVGYVGKTKLTYTTGVDMFAKTARSVTAKYHNIVSCKRVNDIDFPGKYQLKQVQYRRDRPGAVRRSAGQRVESPAIIISPR